MIVGNGNNGIAKRTRGQSVVITIIEPRVITHSLFPISLFPYSFPLSPIFFVISSLLSLTLSPNPSLSLSFSLTSLSPAQGGIKPVNNRSLELTYHFPSYYPSLPLGVKARSLQLTYHYYFEQRQFEAHIPLLCRSSVFSWSSW